MEGEAASAALRRMCAHTFTAWQALVQMVTAGLLK
jgi:hypothetical protein